jgi:hypothetical protein
VEHACRSYLERRGWKMLRQQAGVYLGSLNRSMEDWLGILAELEQYRVWEHFPEDHPYGTREAYFKGEFGQPEPELTRIKKLQQRGVNQYTMEHNGASDPIRSFGTSSAYYRARLVRDGLGEELAAVDAGTMTLKAVARKLGWIKPRIEICPTVQGFTTAVRKHLNGKQRLELIALRSNL